MNISQTYVRTYGGTSILVTAFALKNDGGTYEVTVDGLLLDDSNVKPKPLHADFVIHGAVGSSIGRFLIPLSDGYLLSLSVSGADYATIAILGGITQLSPIRQFLGSGYCPIAFPPVTLDNGRARGLEYMYFNANAGQPSLTVWMLPAAKLVLDYVSFTYITAGGGGNRRMIFAVSDTIVYGCDVARFVAEYLQPGGLTRKYFFSNRNYAHTNPFIANQIAEEFSNLVLRAGQMNELTLYGDGFAAGDTLTDIFMQGTIFFDG